MEALKTYTKEMTLRERVLEILGEMKMTKAELALKLQYSRSAVSQYLNGKYSSDPAEIEAGLREFVQAYEAHAGQAEAPAGAGVKAVPVLKPKVQYFESRDFVQTIGVCQACQEETEEEKDEGEGGRSPATARRTP